MKHLCILVIRLYQWAIAPVKRLLSGGKGSCRYTPSCSHYAIHALQAHGFFKGMTMATLRISRCHPWGGFGLNPVPSRAPWRYVLGLGLDEASWKAHADAINGAVLVSNRKLIAEGDTPSAALERALQGSRSFEGGTLYTVQSREEFSEATSVALTKHSVSLIITDSEVAS